MNRRYKTVFNRTLRIWQVVSELAKGHSKQGRSATDTSSEVRANNLTINGNPTLDGAILNYDLGEANKAGGSFNDLTMINGNLTLSGSTLNVAQTGYDAGEIGAGFTLRLTDGVSLYGEIDHTFFMGGNASELSKGVSAPLGVRVMFGK